MISSIGASGVAPAYGQRPPAPPPPPDPQQKFDELDGDGNGGLDATELQVLAEKHTERTGEQTSVEDLLDRFDTDGSGTLEIGEMPKPGAGEFRGPPPFLAEDGSVTDSPESLGSFNPLESLLSYLDGSADEEESTSLLDLQA